MTQVAPRCSKGSPDCFGDLAGMSCCVTMIASRLHAWLPLPDSLWVTGSTELLLTLPEWADNVASTRPVSQSETLVLLSAELVTSRAPSWEVSQAAKNAHKLPLPRPREGSFIHWIGVYNVNHQPQETAGL